MGVLVIQDRGIPAIEVAEHTGTTGFSSPADDVTADRDCYIKSIELVLPAGESADVVKETANGNDIPFATGLVSGVYALGEEYPLKVGQKLKRTTNNVQSGTREMIISACRK